MEAAGATGKVGPNLDELRPNQGTVAQQVRNGGNGMPSFTGKLSAPRSTRSPRSFHGGRHRARREDLIRAERPEGRRLQGLGLLPAGLRQHGVRRGAEGALRGAPSLSRKNGDRFRGLPSDRAHDRRRRAPALPGNVGKAFAEGDPTCGSGYYHGLLQWKLAGVTPDKVASVARNACSEPKIRANAYNYYQCVHGLGHGLMLYTRYDLPKALDLCHQLRPSDSVVVHRRRLHGEPELLLRHPLEVPEHEEPALPLRRSSRRGQALLLPARHVVHPSAGRHDWKKAADWCRKSDAGWVQYCFQSTGETPRASPSTTRSR